MKQLAISALEASKAIRIDVASFGGPPDEGTPAHTQQVLPASLARGTRGYIERIVNQINGSYEKGWFDSCAVMIRRLIETLIIEVFEHHNIASNIKDPAGEFLYLNDLIGRVISEPTWNLGRDTKVVANVEKHWRQICAQSKIQRQKMGY
jgi:hypothetical protein